MNTERIPIPQERDALQQARAAPEIALTVWRHLRKARGAGLAMTMSFDPEV